MTAPTTFCDECGASNPLQATSCFACNAALHPPAPSPLLPLRTVSAHAAMLERETGGGLLPPTYLLHARYSIARHFKPGKARDTIPLGSKGYAAPEQYGKAQSTPQSDMYGLGATLHQLLTGDDPSLSLFHFEPAQLRSK